MTPRMRILRRARRRIAFDRALRYAAIGLSGASVVAFVMLVFDRLTDAQLSWPWFAVLGVSGILAGVVFGVLRTPATRRVAIMLDASLRLEDRLGSAESTGVLSRARVDAAFAELTRRDADRWAQRLDIRAATPIRASAWWGPALIAALGVASGFIWLPEMAFARETTPLTDEQRDALAQTGEGAASNLEQTVEQLESAASELATQEDLRTLDSLAQQMRQAEQSPSTFQRARDEASEKLADLAQRANDRVARERAAQDALARRFESLGRSGEAASSPEVARSLREALATQSFDEAAQMLERMQRQQHAMSDEERRQLSEAIEQLAEDLRDAHEEAMQAAQVDEASLAKSLERLGVDEQTIDALTSGDATDRKAIEESLRSQGLDEQVARDLAKEIAQHNQRKNAAQNAAESTRSLSDALDEAADRLASPPTSPDGQAPADSPKREPDAPEPPEKPADPRDQTAQERDQQPPPPQNQNDETSRDQQTRNEQREQQEQQQREQTSQTSETAEAANQRADQQDEKQADEQTQSTENQSEESQSKANRPEQTQQDAAKQDAVSQSESAEQQSQSQSQSQSGAQQQQAQQSAQGQGQQQQQQQQTSKEGQKQQQSQQREQQQGQAEQSGAQQQQGQQQQQSGQEGPGSAPAGIPMGQESQQSQGAGEPSEQQAAQHEGAAAESGGEGAGDASTDANELQRAQETLRRLREQQSRSRNAEDQARQLQDAARRLSEQLTPEEREKLNRWARAMEQEEGGGGVSDDMIGDGSSGLTQAPPSESAGNDAQNVDLRSDGLPERTMAEWLIDEQPTGDVGRERTGSASSRSRDVQRAAERAVGDARVPSRYHKFIERYFGRFSDVVDQARSRPPSSSAGEGDTGGGTREGGETSSTGESGEGVE